MLLVIQVAIPLIFYFAVMFFSIIKLQKRQINQKTHLIPFTAANNSFELAIAVAVFGIGSVVAFAAVLEPPPKSSCAYKSGGCGNVVLEMLIQKGI